MALDIAAVDALAGRCGSKQQPIVFADKATFNVKSNLAQDDEFQVRKGRSANTPLDEIPLPSGGTLQYSYPLTGEEKSSSRENGGKVKLFLGSKHTRKIYSCDIQVLSCLKAGMYLTLSDVENIQKVKPFKIKSRRASKTYRTEMQQAVLNIKKRMGANAILKGMNLEEGATGKARNEQIGGHRK